MKTRIRELFNIERPVILGGMHNVGYAEFPGTDPKVALECDVDARAARRNRAAGRTMTW